MSEANIWAEIAEALANDEVSLKEAITKLVFDKEEEEE